MEKYKNLSQKELNQELFVAGESGNLEVVKYLLTSPDLKECADAKSDDFAVFRMACWNGHLEVVRYLLKLFESEGYCCTNNYNNGFMAACTRGHLQIVRYLLASPELKEHADIHTDEDWGFVLACWNGHLDIARYLLTSQELKEHANIHAKFGLGLKLACGNGRLDVIEYLLTSPELKKYGEFSIENKGNSFVLACDGGYLDVVRYLLTSQELKEPVDIHIYGDNAFTIACHKERLDIVKFLIFDVGIEKTKAISDFLKNDEYLEVRKWFEIRDLNDTIKEELSPLKESKKNKI